MQSPSPLKFTDLPVFIDLAAYLKPVVNRKRINCWCGNAGDTEVKPFARLRMVANVNKISTVALKSMDDELEITARPALGKH
jgi:hypothetical protein